MSVVLPAPFTPNSPYTPLVIVKFKSSTAQKSPNFLVTLTICNFITTYLQKTITTMYRLIYCTKQKTYCKYEQHNPYRNNNIAINSIIHRNPPPYPPHKKQPTIDVASFSRLQFNIAKQIPAAITIGNKNCTNKSVNCIFILIQATVKKDCEHNYINNPYQEYPCGINLS